MNINSSVVLQNTIRHDFKYNLYILSRDNFPYLHLEIHHFTRNLSIFNSVFIDLNNKDKS